MEFTWDKKINKKTAVEKKLDGEKTIDVTRQNRFHDAFKARKQEKSRKLYLMPDKNINFMTNPFYIITNKTLAS